MPTRIYVCMLTCQHVYARVIIHEGINDYVRTYACKFIGLYIHVYWFIHTCLLDAFLCSKMSLVMLDIYMYVYMIITLSLGGKCTLQARSLTLYNPPLSVFHRALSCIRQCSPTKLTFPMYSNL